MASSNPNYSPMQTILKGLFQALVTVLSLGFVQYLNAYIKAPVDVSFGKVVIPSAIVVFVATAVKNWLKNRTV